MTWFGAHSFSNSGLRGLLRRGNPSPKLNGSPNCSGATPEPTGGTPALPPNVHPKMKTGKEFPSACIRFPSSPSIVRRVGAARCPYGIRNTDLVWGAQPSRLPFSASRRKPVQQTNLSNDGSGATPEPAGGTPALPPIVQPKMIAGIRLRPQSGTTARQARSSQISVIAQPRACAPRPVRPGRDNRKLARHIVPGCLRTATIRPEGTAESSRLFHRRSAT
jgi:hypothetical protein